MQLFLYVLACVLIYAKYRCACALPQPTTNNQQQPKQQCFAFHVANCNNYFCVWFFFYFLFHSFLFLLLVFVGCCYVCVRQMRKSCCNLCAIGCLAVLFVLSLRPQWEKLPFRWWVAVLVIRNHVAGAAVTSAATNSTNVSAAAVALASVHRALSFFLIVGVTRSQKI